MLTHAIMCMTMHRRMSDIATSKEISQLLLKTMFIKIRGGGTYLPAKLAIEMHGFRALNRF